MRRAGVTRVLLAAAVILAAVAAATTANLILLERADNSDSRVGHLNPQVELVGDSSLPVPTFANRRDDHSPPTVPESRPDEQEHQEDDD